MNPVNEILTSSSIKNYLTDLSLSYKKWTTAFIPLSIDPSASDSELSGRIFQQSGLRRGMGIIEAVNALKQFVLAGEPGSGKSSTLQYLTQFQTQNLIELINSGSTNKKAHFNSRIPVYIELNLYKRSDSRNGITRMIGEAFYPYFFKDSIDDFVENLLINDKLLVILDGLNECPGNDMESAVSDIRSFLKKYPRSAAILSCRTRDYPDIFHLSVLTIQPLSPPAVEKFITRNLSAVPGHDKKVENLKNLIYERFSGFIHSPLLMSIILDVYRDSGWEIPLNQGALFRCFFEKWFKREGIKLRKTSSTTRTMFMFGLTGGIAYMMHNRGEIRTSREKIWSYICRFLEEQIERNIISGDRYKADDLLDELLGMGLLVESENRIKFYHQLFQEFFAAVHLANQNPEEALARFDNSWWEEPLLFYSGLAENCSDLVKHAFESGDIVFAAHILSVSQNCEPGLFTAVIRRLIKLLFDKFAYNRKQSYNYLLVIRNRQIDSVLDELSASSESKEHQKTFKALIADRKKRFKGVMQYPGSELYDSAKFHDKDDPRYVMEQRASYSGSVAGHLQSIEKEILKNGIESGLSMLKEFAGTLGYAEVDQGLRKLIQSVESANRMLFLTWCLSGLLEKRGVDILIEDFQPEAVSRIFPDAAEWKTTPDKRTRLLINILFNAETERLWQLEIAQYELLCHDDPDKEKHFGSALEKNLDNKAYGKSHFEFLFQIFWDMDSAVAESYMIEWLKTRLGTLSGKSIAAFLSRRGGGAEHIEAYIELMKDAPVHLHPFFPEMIAKTGSNKAAGFLMNVIQNELYSLQIREAAIRAFRKLAAPGDKIFLEELINSPDPEIFDPAYEILMEIKKRADEDMKMFKAESADDVNIELLFDEDPAAVWSQPRVSLFRNDLQSAEINGVRINFGPVSGRIFHYLAKNSTLGRYYNAAEIRSHLKIQELVLDDSSVRNRITDIRKRIQTALEGRVEPGLLLENARRFGYRINAEVEIK